ncbi:hypothetical protein [Jiella sp. M17.18]|uniref:hypothetical protein n=1 Tax=Jiella sp. M17.18 TaxID=3234247 RepID=UPI0034DE72DB
MSRAAKERPSVFSDIGIAIKNPEQTPDSGETVVQLAPPKPEKAEKEVIKTSTYLPRPVHDVLREIAFHERSKVHDLLMEGIEHILKTRRHPSVAELKERSDA